MIEAVLDKTTATAARLEWGGSIDARLARIARGAAGAFAPHIAFARLSMRVDAPVARTKTIHDLPAREKAAFTLRLDPVRHACLKQACASSQRSAQHIVTQALDAFLAAKSGPVRAADAAIRSGDF